MSVQGASTGYQQSTGARSSKFSSDGKTDGRVRQILQETLGKEGKEELLYEIKQQSRFMISEQKARFARELESIAKAFHEVAKKLQEDDRPLAAQYTDMTAQHVHRFSGYLQDREFSEILEDVGAVARRNPAILVGGALAAGFFLARFIAGSRDAGDRGKAFNARQVDQAVFQDTPEGLEAK